MREITVTSSNRKPGLLVIKGKWVKKLPEFSEVGDCKLRFTGFSFMMTNLQVFSVGKILLGVHSLQALQVQASPSSCHMSVTKLPSFLASNFTCQV